MKKLIALPCLALWALALSAATLHIGSSHPYANFEQAAAAAQPGDTILFHAGSYAGGQYVANLQGTPDAWIYIQPAPGEAAIIEGGTNAIQLTDPAYLHFSGLTFQHQTGNGFNTDDGGSYDTPAHHVIFQGCTFRDMSATGNNDLLKLSGLDYFEIRNCIFLNGAEGGSGIDMVGCHHGVIQGNSFESLGSNSIQAKGGTEHIRIEANFFQDGGQRTLNLGGSTGLDFFRPDTAHFEAANLQVYSNVIVGSWAAIAYVGSVNVEVVNNTIYQPENWVIRILQETVDPDRFLECGDNTFRNNIVVLDNGLSTETNIGPNTRPETFLFSNNLWYNTDDANWGGPSIPVTDVDGILNQDPLFSNPTGFDFHIPTNSPATGAGLPVSEPQLDFYGQGFASPPSIGAAEANPVSSTAGPAAMLTSLELFPNPSSDRLTVQYTLSKPTTIRIELVGQNGQSIALLPESLQSAGSHQQVFNGKLPVGWYVVRLKVGEQVLAKRWVRVAN